LSRRDRDGDSSFRDCVVTARAARDLASRSDRKTRLRGAEKQAMRAIPSRLVCEPLLYRPVRWQSEPRAELMRGSSYYIIEPGPLVGEPIAFTEGFYGSVGRQPTLSVWLRASTILRLVGDPRQDTLLVWAFFGYHDDHKGAFRRRAKLELVRGRYALVRFFGVSQNVPKVASLLLTKPFIIYRRPP